MESKIDSFSKLSSRSMSFSVKEETKGEELFFTKFPTFEDITMDEQLKSNITIETLESDIQNCDEMLTNLKSSLENLFTTNQIIVDKFAEYKINYIKHYNTCNCVSYSKLCLYKCNKWCDKI